MLNVFLFVVLPYAALAMLLFVTPYRYYSNRLTWSAYSTQFLEGIGLLFYGLNQASERLPGAQRRKQNVLTRFARLFATA